jgi:large subunit ribosomal protein L22
MGARKHITAEQRKAEKKQKAIAILRDCPTSPRKMRLVADIVRGVEINKALGILRFSKKEASIRVEKLLRSAIANWEAKNEGQRLEDNNLCVKEIFVDCGRQLKRIQPAPQGRAHRVRKRSNHVTIVVDRMPEVEAKAAKTTKTAKAAPAAAKTEVKTAE